MVEQLFENKSFWLSRNIPQRNYLKDQIEKYGGTVVIRESDADVLLVDHLKRNSATDTYSYQFIEVSIRTGKLQKLQDFRVGQDSGSTRPAGSSTVAPKRSRNPFSAKDDQILYDWVKPLEESGSGSLGTRIYQQLEQKYPHHTWQSWRERYRNIVRHRPRPVLKEPLQDSNSMGRTPQQEPASPRIRQDNSTYRSFTDAERSELLACASDILEVDPDREDECWETFAKEKKSHSAAEWKSYFHTFIRPEYEMKMRARRASIIAKSPKAKKRHTQSGRLESTETHHRSLELTQTTSEKHTGSTKDKISEPNQETTRKRRRTLPSSLSSTIAHGPTSQEQNRKATDSILEGSAAASLEIERNEHVKTTHSKRQRPSEDSLQVSSPQSEEDERSSKRARQGSNRSSSLEEDLFETAPQFPSLDELLAGQIPTSNGSGHPPDARPEDDEKEIEEVDDWIDSRKNQGFDEQQIIDALRCTSMDIELADTVLQHLKEGKGIPTDMKGVWTQEDDDAFTDSNARAIKKLEEKHGTEYVNARFEYLNIVGEVSIDTE